MTPSRLIILKREQVRVRPLQLLVVAIMIGGPTLLETSPMKGKLMFKGQNLGPFSHMSLTSVLVLIFKTI